MCENKLLLFGNQREESHENPRTSIAVGKCILWRRPWCFYCSRNFHCDVKLHQQKKHSVRIMSSEASCAGKGLHYPLGSRSPSPPPHTRKRKCFLVLFNLKNLLRMAISTYCTNMYCNIFFCEVRKS